MIGWCDGTAGYVRSSSVNTTATFCIASYQLKNDSTELTMMSANSVKQQDALRQKMLNTVLCTAKPTCKLEGTS